MNPQKTTAKDFFLNLGAIIALYTVVINLTNLLFTVIDKAYPQITSNYYYGGTYSISFPVATLIIFFPIFILLMWLLEKDYVSEPEKRQLGVRKWLTYITLFISGLVFAGDLVTVLYEFIDGQELTTGFLLKVSVVLVMSLLVFLYYISDVREKLTSMSRKVWLVVSLLIILAGIVWGFSVLGSPRTQQLIKYDEQKVSDLQNIIGGVDSYVDTHGMLPKTLNDIFSNPYNGGNLVLFDEQTKQPYGYNIMDELVVGNNIHQFNYSLCATFNESFTDTGSQYWSHPAGYYCFTQSTTQSPNTPPIDQ